MAQPAPTPATTLQAMINGIWSNSEEAPNPAAAIAMPISASGRLAMFPIRGDSTMIVPARHISSMVPTSPAGFR